MGREAGAVEEALEGGKNQSIQVVEGREKCLQDAPGEPWEPRGGPFEGSTLLT